MKKCIFLILILMIMSIKCARAVVITDENFETEVSGWSDNSTEDENNDFTKFLGRHGETNGQYLSKTYELSGDQTEVIIQFDFYEIDSWDNELLRMYIDDEIQLEDEYAHYRTDIPSHTTLLFGGGTNYGFSSWPDQANRYLYKFETDATSLKLGFGSTLDQPIYDESWGIDNVFITSNDSANNSVPEPTTMTLLGMSIIALFGIKRKIKI